MAVSRPAIYGAIGAKVAKVAKVANVAITTTKFTTPGFTSKTSHAL